MRLAGWLPAMLAVALAGCASLPPNARPVPQDPFERVNRGVFAFNDALDRALPVRAERISDPWPPKLQVSLIWWRYSARPAFLALA